MKTGHHNQIVQQEPEGQEQRGPVPADLAAIVDDLHVLIFRVHFAVGVNNE